MRGKPVKLALFAAAVLALALCASASGERSQSGNLIVSLKGEITPHFLPRTRPVPVAIGLSSDFSTADGGPLPQLRQIAIEVGNRGKLGYRGLPVCKPARVRVTSKSGALAACGSALVGKGHLGGQIGIDGQAPFAFDGRILAFNSRLADGRVVALADVHSEAPPVSFVMPFVIHGGGKRGTKLVAKLPHLAGGLIHVTHFDLTLKRRFRYRGEERSYLSANCAVPRGFTALVFPLLQATYTFAGGHSVTATATRGCSVRK